MKKLYALLAFAGLLNLHVHSQALAWVKQTGGITVDIGNSIVIDKDSNVYLTGSFEGLVDFDPGLGIHTLLSAGASDIFVSKLDSLGNLIWVRQIGGTEADYPGSLGLDASGSVYLTGYFNGTADFDPSGSFFNLTSFGDDDIFVSKLTAAGDFAWAVQMGGTGSDRGASIAADGSANVYITGTFEGVADFDPGNSYTYSSVGFRDAFVTKLDSSGNFIWANQIGGSLLEMGASVAADGDNNIYVTGGFQGIVDFDRDTSKYSLSAIGDWDVFVTKLDSTGSLIWAKSFGGGAADIGYGIKVENSTDVYLTGYFGGLVDFDSGSNTFNLTSAGGNDGFVCKFDSAGNFIWANQMGGALDDQGTAIIVDGSGNVYTTGFFQGTADFYSGTGTYNLTSMGSSDIFVNKTDSSGTYIWAKQFGGSGDDKGNAVALDGAGDLYATGYFNDTADFDPASPVFPLISLGQSDIYLLKLRGTCVSTTSTLNVASCDSYISPAGNVHTTSGTFNDTITNISGCDSVITINLIIHSSPQPTISPAALTICEGGSAVLTASGGVVFVWSNGLGNTAQVTAFPSATTTYTVTVVDANACTASVSRTVTVNSAPTAGISLTVVNVCLGGSTTLIASGGGTYVWSNALGSNSTINVSPTVTTTYAVTVTDANACTASASRTVTVIANPVAVISPAIADICSGDSTALTAIGGLTYNWSHNLGDSSTVIVSPAGTISYSVTVTDANACSGTASRIVTVHQNPAAAISPATVAICNGEDATLIASGGISYAWSDALGSNATVTVSPQLTSFYSVTVTDANDCSATAGKTVTVHQPAMVTQNNTVCFGTVFPFGGQLLDTAGTYYDTLSTVFGCDSMITLNLAFDSFAASSFNISICQGNSFTFNGQVLTSTGLYADTLVSSTGCDSIVTLNLVVNNNPPAAISPALLTVCRGAITSLTASGGTSYQWSNSLGTNAMVVIAPLVTTSYSVTVTDINGCSATAARTVNVNQNPVVNIFPATVNICFGDSADLTASGGITYNWSNSLGSNATVTVNPLLTNSYSVTVSDINGCTAVATKTVTVSQPVMVLQDNTICFGTSFPFGGQLLSNPGIYYDTLTAITGCDSMITLNLSVGPFAVSSFNVNICHGNSYSYNGQNLTASGVYVDTLQSSTGCDSIVTLHLSINSTSSSVSQTICQGNSFSFNGQSLTAGGIYNATFVNSTGCDSIVTLQLTVIAPTTFSYSQTICSGDAYPFNGQMLTVQGVYTDTLVASSTCDSIITLTLSVNNLPVPVISRSNDTLRTQTFASYQWLRNGAVINGATSQSFRFTQNGNYRVIVTDANGCSDTSVVFNVSNVGIADILSDAAIKLYPNPNSGSFTLEFSNDGVREIEISDDLGRVIASDRVTERIQQLNLPSSPAGIYFLRIRQNEVVKTLKFSLME